MIQAAKILGIGIATTGLIGAGIWIWIGFSSYKSNFNVYHLYWEIVIFFYINIYAIFWVYITESWCVYFIILVLTMLVINFNNILNLNKHLKHIRIFFFCILDKYKLYLNKHLKQIRGFFVCKLDKYKLYLNKNVNILLDSTSLPVISYFVSIIFVIYINFNLFNSYFNIKETLFLVLGLVVQFYTVYLICISKKISDKKKYTFFELIKYIIYNIDFFISILILSFLLNWMFKWSMYSFFNTDKVIYRLFTYIVICFSTLLPLRYIKGIYTQFYIKITRDRGKKIDFSFSFVKNSIKRNTNKWIIFILAGFGFSYFLFPIILHGIYVVI